MRVSERFTDQAACRVRRRIGLANGWRWRRRLGRKLLEVRYVDLRFTHEETRALLRNATSLEPDAATVDLLQECTEGWIAGLRLAALVGATADNVSRHAHMPTLLVRDVSANPIDRILVPLDGSAPSAEATPSSWRHFGRLGLRSSCSAALPLLLSEAHQFPSCSSPAFRGTGPRHFTQRRKASINVMPNGICSDICRISRSVAKNRPDSGSSWLGSRDLVILTQGAIMSEWIELITAIAALLQALQWPLLALTIGLLWRDEIKLLMRRSRSWKVLGVEGEFSDLVEDLADSTSMPGESGPGTDAIERRLETGAERVGDSDSWSEIFRLAAVSPRAALMQLAAEIEETLIDKAQRHMAGDDQFDDLDASRINMRDATNLLVTLGLMPLSLSENLADFREIRNRVVHGGEGSDAEILSAIDSGLTILRQLDAIDALDDQ